MPDGTRIMFKLTDDRVAASDAMATIAIDGADLRSAIETGYTYSWHPRLRPTP